MRELDAIRAKIGRCETGSAVATGAGRLPARWVFHAVGPVFSGGRRDEAARLASCYRTCLEMAEERNLATITFPSISTGAYRYPLEEAARIALGVVTEHLQREHSSLREVTFVLYDFSAYEAHRAALDELNPVE